MKKIDLYKDFISKYEPFNINEGLIKSQEPIIVMSIMPRLLRASGINFILDNTATGQIFIEVENIKQENLNFIFSLIGNFGYYGSDMILNGIDRKFNSEEIDSWFKLYDTINITIFIEPYYDRNIKIIPQILYHVTPIKYIEKILKNGLSPKNKDKISTHPPRVSLGFNKNKTISLGKSLRSSSSYIDELWELLEIDTTKINDFKIYQDPNFKSGCYSLNYIPPSAIKSTSIQF